MPVLVHVHGQERSTGVEPQTVQRLAHAGRLVRVRRGTYVGADDWRELDDRARHVVQVQAVLAVARRPPVFSHWSAAAVLGLPGVGRRDGGVHVVRGPAGGGRSHGDVVRHAVAGSVDVTVVDGITVTSPARTVVDLARVGGVVTGVAAADAAVRHGLVTVEELHAEVERAGQGRGVRAARRTAALVDARSESPGESLSRVRMAEWGLGAPVLQHEVRDRHGLVGRVDFWWPVHGVVGEFDGRTKYGSDAADVLWEEKLREDRLRAAGLRVARWTWQDAWAGVPMIARLRAAGVR
ncbi:type IV toxin-antitoxin system AbiEi family antitoxin domain-containing protein [Cellulomonas sp. zg-B12]|nr:type IV toxin-antitoxin system AbiEi family antitoxin domain-containing protein [Cellulomonas xiejunii]